MKKTSASPLHGREFAAFFAVQFCGALNDNVYRNIVVTMLAFGVLSHRLEQGGLGAALHLAVGLFMLPLLLFSATGGLIADHYAKRKLIIIIKLAEIFLMLLAGVAFATGDISLMMLTLFLMGTQSAFFGPIKYSYLPEMFPKESELVFANGLVSGSTHISILLGVLLGVYLGGLPEEARPILLSTTAVVAIAALGFSSSLLIPAAGGARAGPPAMPGGWLLTALRSFPGHTWGALRRPQASRPAFTAILGISWFWLVGALFLTWLPLFTDRIGYPVEVYRALLMLTCVCVALGALSSSVLISRIGMRIAAPCCCVALAAISLALVHFSFAGEFAGPGTEAAAWRAFLAEGAPAYQVAADIAVLSFFEGFLVVPLITRMQQSADTACRARVIAANNIYNALFIVAGAALFGALGDFAFADPNDAYAALGACTLAYGAFIAARMRRDEQELPQKRGAPPGESPQI